ncbi:hypothetical protein DFH07DRAFT_763427 [Mycena maculata]|uniref:Uncharacterized protein n=1 Tax=Mycena maculata TaxID=230809 RepID=A0AAD7MDN3_9AGAR|nr:hypothetical protein DFH07DRAFT_763427 [Mycena maculata]
MPTLAVAEASNAAFSPTYIPVALFVGGTSGVGQAMAEAFARQTNGRAHIILIGRNEGAARDIFAGLPKPLDTEGCAYEFVYCDATSMVNIRTVCAGLRARLPRINFLILTASGPAANTMIACGETPEGLDNHLAMRYFARYVFTKELLPLLVAAQEEGQSAHLMTVLGAGLGFKIPTDDLGLDAARRSSIKGMIRGAAYNDGLVASFAAQHLDIAFTHIYPGQVKTTSARVNLGWLLAPLTWLLERHRSAMRIPQDECAQYMLYALLDAERGMFIRDNHGDVVCAHVFTADHGAAFDTDSPTTQEVVRFTLFPAFVDSCCITWSRGFSTVCQ